MIFVVPKLIQVIVEGHACKMTVHIHPLCSSSDKRDYQKVTICYEKITLLHEYLHVARNSVASAICGASLAIFIMVSFFLFLGFLLKSEN